MDFEYEALCGALGTGGPRDPAMCPSLEDLRRELAGLTFLVGRELERDVREGRRRHGRAAVVQVLARKAGLPRPPDHAGLPA